MSRGRWALVSFVCLLLCPARVVWADSIDIERLVDVWRAVSMSRGITDRLSSSVEVSFESGAADRVVHQELVKALKREKDKLAVREAELLEALGDLEAQYTRNPSDVSAALTAAISEYERAGRSRPAQWLRDTLDLFDEEVILDVQPPDLPAHVETNDVAIVQRFLIEYFDQSVSIEKTTGHWVSSTQQSVAVALRALEVDIYWADGWGGGANGVLMPEWFWHLMLRVEDGPEDAEAIQDVGRFLMSLWALRAERVYIPEPFRTTGDRLLAVMLGQEADGYWDVGDVYRMVSLYAVLKADPLYEEGWPPDDRLEDLLVHAITVRDRIVGDPSYSRDQQRQAFLFACFIETYVEFAADVTHLVEEYNTLCSIQEVQVGVAERFPDLGVVIGETWGMRTAYGVTLYLRGLQEAEIGWDGPVDGLYTLAFADHIWSWLETLDPEHPEVLAHVRFFNAMDHLVEVGVYSPIEAESLSRHYVESQRASGQLERTSKAESVDWLSATLLTWFNGFLWEFGDEALCGIISMQHGRERGVEFYRKATEVQLKATGESNVWIILWSMIGRITSLLTVWAMWWAEVKGHKSRWGAFKAGVGYELFEGVATVVGECMTLPPHGMEETLKFLGMSLVATLVSGVLLGVALMKITKEPASSPKRKVKQWSTWEGVVVALGLFWCYVHFIVNGKL